MESRAVPGRSRDARDTISDDLRTLLPPICATGRGHNLNGLCDQVIWARLLLRLPWFAVTAISCTARSQRTHKLTERRNHRFSISPHFCAKTNRDTVGERTR
jgi:hypothetical protein